MSVLTELARAIGLVAWNNANPSDCCGAQCLPYMLKLVSYPLHHNLTLLSHCVACGMQNSQPWLGRWRGHLPESARRRLFG